MGEVTSFLSFPKKESVGVLSHFMNATPPYLAYLGPCESMSEATHGRPMPDQGPMESEKQTLIDVFWPFG